MSLKTLHTFVVLASIVACCAYGMWGVAAFLRDGAPSSLYTAVPAIVGGLALLMHGVIFYKHTEDEPWL